MIRKIAYQDSRHQYDEYNNSITTWDSKKCAWIVNKEFEREEIDWWGKDNDFPTGLTLEEFEKNNPDWAKLPDIVVTWTWNTKEAYRNAFGSPFSFGESFDYYDKQEYPQKHTKQWGYIECSEEDAVERFAGFADHNKHADDVTVMYNGKLIFNGVYNKE